MGRITTATAGAASLPTLLIPLGGRVIHRDGWKLIPLADGREELYHLTDDPFEKTNLAGTDSARREQLKRILAETRKGDLDVIPADLRAFEETKGVG